jgi:hypothetical protein
MQSNPTMILSNHQRATIQARLDTFIRLAADADKRGLHKRCERYNDHHDALLMALARLDDGRGDLADQRLVCDVLGIKVYET